MINFLFVMLALIYLTMIGLAVFVFISVSGACDKFLITIFIVICLDNLIDLIKGRIDSLIKQNESF